MLKYGLDPFYDKVLTGPQQKEKNKANVTLRLHPFYFWCCNSLSFIN